MQHADTKTIKSPTKIVRSLLASDLKEFTLNSLHEVVCKTHEIQKNPILGRQLYQVVHRLVKSGLLVADRSNKKEKFYRVVESIESSLEESSCNESGALSLRTVPGEYVASGEELQARLVDLEDEIIAKKVAANFCIRQIEKYPQMSSMLTKLQHKKRLESLTAAGQAEVILAMIDDLS